MSSNRKPGEKAAPPSEPFKRSGAGCLRAVETRLPAEDFPKTRPYEWIDVLERLCERDRMEAER